MSKCQNYELIYIYIYRINALRLDTFATKHATGNPVYNKIVPQNHGKPINSRYQIYKFLDTQIYIMIYLNTTNIYMYIDMVS